MDRRRVPAVIGLPTPVLLDNYDSLTPAFTVPANMVPFALDATNKVRPNGALRFRGNGALQQPYGERAIAPGSLTIEQIGDVIAGRVYIRRGILGGTFFPALRTPSGLVPLAANKIPAFVNTADGWYPFAVKVSDYGIAAGTAITGVRFETPSPTGQPRVPDFNLGPLYANAGGIPTFIFSLDDSYKSQKGTSLVFEEFGMRANFNVNQDYIENDNGTRLNLADITAMYSAGHDICVNPLGDVPLHASTLPSGSASVANAVANMQQTRQYLIANGMPRGADFGDYSNGIYSDMVYKTPPSPVAFTSNGTTAITLSSAPLESDGTTTSTLIAGMAVYGSPIPDGTVIAAGGVNGLNITLSNAVPASSTTQLRFIDESGPFYGNKLTSALRTAGFKIIRSVGSALTGGFAVTHTRFGLGNFDMQFPAQPWGSGTTVQAMKDQIDATIALKGTGCAYIHYAQVGGRGTIGMELDDLREVLAYLKSKVDAGLIQVLTWSQLWARDGAATLPAV